MRCNGIIISTQLPKRFSSNCHLSLNNLFLLFKRHKFMRRCTTVLITILPIIALGQNNAAYKPDTTIIPVPGYTLAWHDEFNKDGRPDSANWNYETGFVRNEELQYYQPNNVACVNGTLVIEGRKEEVPNPRYVAGSTDWRRARQYANYTSACITTKGLQQFGYGRFEIRARIDTSMGAWPAIWALGTRREWPDNGEVDIMEFYRVNGTNHFRQCCMGYSQTLYRKMEYAACATGKLYKE